VGATAGIDVALTEAAIGGGLTGALLIGAAAGCAAPKPPRAPNARPGNTLAGGVVSAAVTAAPRCSASPCAAGPAPTLAPLVLANIAVTEVGNPITAVLLAFRAMDTLLEAIVLLFALIGVWSLAPDSAWGGRPGLRSRPTPTACWPTLARVLPPIGIVIGHRTSSGSAPTIRAASSRAPPSWPPCGCWS
jgi:hypothetical protein